MAGWLRAILANTLIDVLRRFQAGARDSAQVLSREELLARYPEFAAELGRFLDDQERVERCAAPLRAGAAAAAGGTRVPGGSEGTAAEAGGSRLAGPLRCLGDYELLEEI